MTFIQEIKRTCREKPIYKIGIWVGIALLPICIGMNACRMIRPDNNVEANLIQLVEYAKLDALATGKVQEDMFVRYKDIRPFLGKNPPPIENLTTKGCNGTRKNIVSWGTVNHSMTGKPVKLGKSPPVKE